MQTSRRSIVIVAAMAATIIASSFVSAMAANAAAPRRHVVEIRKSKFVPAELEVSLGDTIVWINRDIVPHTATAKGKSWDSNKLKKGGQWQVVVQGDMALAYYCRFHPVMKGLIRIVQ